MGELSSGDPGFVRQEKLKELRRHGFRGWSPATRNQLDREDQKKEAGFYQRLGRLGGCVQRVGPFIRAFFEELADAIRGESLEQRRRRLGTGGPMPSIPPGAFPTAPPVLLDLKGSGRIDTVSVNDGVYFDYDGNGFAEATGWVSPDAGILVMDRNGNGVLDDGSELFGNFTPLPNGQSAADGFEALAALDGNHDGKIDAQDPAYSQLRVWVNAGGDGHWEQCEMLTLPQLGITSIDLDWTTVNTTDAQGNIELYAGSFQWSDGTTGVIADYGFRIEPSRTIPLETLSVPDDIAGLPDVPASGLVYNLQQAMVRDTSGRLEALVEQFAAENDPNIRTGLTDRILFQWTDSENIDPNSRGAGIDARKLAVLEGFMGEQWSSPVAYQGNYGNPNPGASVILDGLYRDISASVYGMLMSQTHFKDFFGMVNYTVDPNTQEITIDSNSVTAMFNQLKSEVASDPVHGQELLEFTMMRKSRFGDCVVSEFCPGNPVPIPRMEI